MSTLLADLAKERVSGAVLLTLGRTFDLIAEELAADILKEPGFREHVRQLARQAFVLALVELTKPTEDQP